MTHTSFFTRLPLFILITPSKKFTHLFSLVGPILKKYSYLIKKEVAQYIKNSPRIIFNSQLYLWIPRFFMTRASILLNDASPKKQTAFFIEYLSLLLAFHGAFLVSTKIVYTIISMTHSSALLQYLIILIN